MTRTAMLSVTTALAGLMIATPALADPITLDASQVGTSFTVGYNGFVDGDQVVDGLGGSATFTLTGVTDTSYTFGYSVTNETDSGVGSRISSFAFNTDPDIDSASSTGTFNYAQLSSHYPNQIGGVDVCFQGGDSNSCAGNSGGVTTGNTGTGSLTLGFDSPIGSLSLDDFFVRYQSITGAGNVTSASGAGTITSSTSTSSGGTQVPEPGMLVLFGLGLIGVAYASRRKQPGSRPMAPAFA